MKNIYRNNGDVTEIIVMSNKYGTVISQIDTEDIRLAEKYNWCLLWQPTVNGFYLTYSSKKTGTIRLHRLLTHCPKGLVVDHINRNTLDNRKCNLRVCSQSDNLKNRKIYNHSSEYKYFRVSTRKENGRKRYDVAVPNTDRHQFSDINEARAYYIECLMK